MSASTRGARGTACAHIVIAAWLLACTTPAPAPSEEAPAEAASASRTSPPPPSPPPFRPTVASRCNVGYPEDFPCLEGSEIYPGEIIVPVTPDVRLAAALVYPTTALELSQRLNDAATAAGWRNAPLAPGARRPDEPLRTEHFRDGQKITTSIAPYGEAALLQVVVYGTAR